MEDANFERAAREGLERSRSGDGRGDRGWVNPIIGLGGEATSLNPDVWVARRMELGMF